MNLDTDGYILLDEDIYFIFKKWSVVKFIESCHMKYNSYIVNKLKNFNWTSYNKTKYKTNLEDINIDIPGLQIWVSNLPSISPNYPYHYSGTRFYISVSEIYKKYIGNIIKNIPEKLKTFLNISNGGFIQNMGWVLIPPKSDYQILHQDYTINGMYHILWKPDNRFINTQIIPSCFDINKAKYTNIKQTKAQAILFKSNLVHRGKDTLDTSQWVSTLSIEFRTTIGQLEWKNTYPDLYNSKIWDFIEIQL